MRSHEHRRPVGPAGCLDEATLLERGEGVDVLFEHGVDEFDHARAAGPRRDDIGLLLDGWQRIRDGDGKSGGLDEGVIVFRVADSHDIVMGETKVIERDLKAARLVHRAAGSSPPLC